MWLRHLCGDAAILLWGQGILFTHGRYRTDFVKPPEPGGADRHAIRRLPAGGGRPGWPHLLARAARRGGNALRLDRLDVAGQPACIKLLAGRTLVDAAALPAQVPAAEV